jgi:hypothetical protein
MGRPALAAACQSATEEELDTAAQPEVARRVAKRVFYKNSAPGNSRV